MQKILLKLKSSLKLAENVREFCFESPEGIDLNFEPGQFFILDVQDGKEPKITRSYSAASKPNGESVSFCVSIVPDGRGSNYLDGLRPGDEALWQGPFGHFLLGEPKGDVIFVATGAGIAPFMSMIESLLDDGFKNQISLYFGVRHEGDLFYQDRLAEWEKKHPNFEAYLTLSRPDENWKGMKGRVTEHLKNLDFDNANNVDVFICGNGNMVRDVKKLLEEKALPKENIHFEMFTPIK